MQMLQRRLFSSTFQLLVLGTIIVVPCRSEPAPRSILVRTLKIQPVGGDAGSAFAIEVDNKQYLITAKHVVKSLTGEGGLIIDINDKSVPMPVKVFPCADPMDVAVVVAPQQLARASPLPISSMVAPGMDLHFAGFPLGKSSPRGTVRFPFIKRAILSGWGPEGSKMMYLDAVSTRGMSGGPIYSPDPQQVRDPAKPEPTKFVINGVISAFENDATYVHEKIPLKRSEIAGAKAADHRIIKEGEDYFTLIPSKFVALVDSALAIGYSLDCALEIIAKNPLGPEYK